MESTSYDCGDISAAAARILTTVRRRCYGTLPSTFDTVAAVCFDYGLDIAPVYSKQTFRAELIEWSPDRWAIRYNALHPERRRIRYLYHELAEYIAIGDFPGLFDGIRGGLPHRFDGGFNPMDIRHRVATAVVAMILKSIDAQT